MILYNAKQQPQKANTQLLILLNSRNLFLQSVVETVTMEEISPQLVFNWDQTGMNIVPSSSWTIEEKGSKRIELVGIKDKRQITAVFCCTIQGDFLPVQLIYKGTTRRCHPKHNFPAGWDITHPK